MPAPPRGPGTRRGTPIVTPPVSALRARSSSRRPSSAPRSRARRRRTSPSPPKRSPTRPPAAARRAPQSSTFTCETPTARPRSRANASPRPSPPFARRPTASCRRRPGGAVGMSIDERAQPLGCRPEMATLNCGTINFGDDVFVNTRPHIRDLAAAHPRRPGACRSSSATRSATSRRLSALCARGPSRTPLHFQFVLGVPGGIGATRGEPEVHARRSSRPRWQRNLGRRRGGPPPAANDRARDAARRARARRARGQHLPRRRASSPKGAPRSSRARPTTRGSIGRTPVEPDSGADPARHPPQERSMMVPPGLDSALRRTFLRGPSLPTVSPRSRRTPRFDRLIRERASFLLESVVAGDRWGRYSILGYRPRYDAIARRQWLDDPRRRKRHPRRRPDPLAAAEALFRATDASAPGEPGREARARQLRLPRVGPRARDREGARLGNRGHASPLGALLRRRDHRRLRRALRTRSPSPRSDEEDVERAHADLDDPGAAPPDRAARTARASRRTWRSTWTTRPTRQACGARRSTSRRATRFRSCSRASSASLASGRDPFDVYRAMRVINPSPVHVLPRFARRRPAKRRGPKSRARAPRRWCVSRTASMTVRPLAGTRPRGKTPEEDAALEHELLADPKERAEHVMLIDLGRNDVGRVAEIGQRRARAADGDRALLARHAHRERGAGARAARSTPPLEVVRAAFPAGTLSGAPKVRAMQIIRELEAGAARHLRRRGRLRGARPGTSTSRSPSARPSAGATSSRSPRARGSSRRACRRARRTRRGARRGASSARSKRHRAGRAVDFRQAVPVSAVGSQT